MADNVDNDVCSYIGKSISTSTSSLKQIDLTQTNHHHHQQQQPQQHHRHHVYHHQQLDDDGHINKPISISTDVSKMNISYFHYCIYSPFIRWSVGFFSLFEFCYSDSTYLPNEQFFLVLIDLISKIKPTKSIEFSYLFTLIKLIGAYTHNQKAQLI